MEDLFTRVLMAVLERIETLNSNCLVLICASMSNSCTMCVLPAISAARVYVRFTAGQTGPLNPTIAASRSQCLAGKTSSLSDVSGMRCTTAGLATQSCDLAQHRRADGRDTCTAGWARNNQFHTASELHEQHLDMTALARECWDALAGERRDGRGRPAGAHELPEATGDRRLVRQVWATLLRNAVTYTGTREDPRPSGSRPKSVGPGPGQRRRVQHRARRPPMACRSSGCTPTFPAAGMGWPSSGGSCTGTAARSACTANTVPAPDRLHPGRDEVNARLRW